MGRSPAPAVPASPAPPPHPRGLAGSQKQGPENHPGPGGSLGRQGWAPRGMRKPPLIANKGFGTYFHRFTLKTSQTLQTVAHLSHQVTAIFLRASSKGRQLWRVGNLTALSFQKSVGTTRRCLAWPSRVKVPPCSVGCKPARCRALQQICSLPAERVRQGRGPQPTYRRLRGLLLLIPFWPQLGKVLQLLPLLRGQLRDEP